jgi:plastocyanin
MQLSKFTLTNYHRKNIPTAGNARFRFARCSAGFAAAIVLITVCLRTQAATYRVTTSGSVFDPIEVDINAGETILWENNDATEHTVTADATLDDGVIPIFDSGDIPTEDGDDTSASKFTVTFNTPGTNTYYCRIHGHGMSGVIVVSAAAPDNPPVTPANLSPANNATNQPLTVQLNSSVFSDLDSDTHAASQWVLKFASSGVVAVDSGEVSDVGSLTDYLPAGLTNGTSYEWQVRYKDNRGAWSDYSASTRFTTVSNVVAVPALLTARGFTNGNWRLITGVGSPSAVITVAASTNFLQWTNIGTATSDVSGNFLFMDSNAVLFNTRFYRAHN